MAKKTYELLVADFDVDQDHTVQAYIDFFEDLKKTYGGKTQVHMDAGHNNVQVVLKLPKRKK